MAKAHPIKTSFNAGEWSPLMEGHINLQNWPDSMRLCQNMIPLKQGPVVRRGGTKFIKEVKNSGDDTALIPFEFSTTQAYQIEAGDAYFRFYKDNAAIVETGILMTGATAANPVVLTITQSWSDGDEIYIDGVVGMTELNGKYYKINNRTATTVELQDVDGNNIDGSAYTTYVSGGTGYRVYEVTSPYSEADLFDTDGLYDFQYAQSADVLYIAHGDYKTRSLGRTSDTSWTVTNMTFDDGPYLPLNDTTTTLTLSGTTGSVTVTASATTGINGGDGFKSTDVGRLIRWEDPANEWTWLKITAWSSTTQVTATISGQDASAGTATTDWRLGVYSDTTGYPRVITFYQDRVLLAGCPDYPDRYDLTRTGGYSDTTFQFAPTDVDGTVTDDAAINGTLQSGQVNSIQWARSDDKGLILGTAAREWLVRPSTSGEVLTPSNAKADPFSSIGSSYVQPIQAENGTVYAQRARRKLMDVIYNFERDQLKPRDLTLASEHISRTGIAQIQHQQEPLNTIWMRLTNGLLKGMTYYPDEAVFGAHRHVIGGDGVVKSISVIPNADGSRDELWMIVERTINSVTRKYVEYMTRFYEDDIDQEDYIAMDSALTYDGSATDTVTGLDHLEGETVRVSVDGKSHPDLTVSSGSVTLDNSVTGSVIHVGLATTWAIKPQRIEAGATDGTAQGKIKRINGIVIRVLNSLGLSLGPSASNVKEYDFDQYDDGFDTVTPLYTGDTQLIRWAGGYEQNGDIYLTSSDIHPMAILAIMPQLTTQDR